MAEPATQPVTAVAPRTRLEAAKSYDDAAGAGAIALRPQNFTQAIEMANLLATSALIPSALQNKPQDVLCVLITGHEIGLSPMQALRGMHVIEGKGSMSADLMAGLVISRTDVCKYLRPVESTEKVCTIETLRVGHPEPVRFSYTIEQAQRAGLTNKKNWQNDPQAMLIARAKTRICRAVYPDLCFGLYSEEEAEDGIVRGPERAANITPASGSPTRLGDLTERIRAGETRMPAAPVEEARTIDAEVVTAADPDPSTDDHPFGAEPISASAQAALGADAPKQAPAPKPAAARPRRF